jgi:hypothetical protein
MQTKMFLQEENFRMGRIFVGENFQRGESSRKKLRWRIFGGEFSGENFLWGESSGENLRRELSRENLSWGQTSENGKSYGSKCNSTA